MSKVVMELAESEADFKLSVCPLSLSTKNKSLW